MTQAQLTLYIQQLNELLRVYPVVSALLLMMALDIASGLAVAIGTKTLSSTISWRGMCKKAITIVIVGAAAVFTPFAGGLELTKMTAFGFLCAELLSVLENAGKLGVPLPTILTETLQKLRTDAEVKRVLPAAAAATAAEVVATAASTAADVVRVAVTTAADVAESETKKRLTQRIELPPTNSTGPQ